jgi:betaine-homocysteine S-methyltransferase
LTSGSITQCPSYLNGAGKEKVQAEFRKQVKVLVEADLDFLICEVGAAIYT